MMPNPTDRSLDEHKALMSEALQSLGVADLTENDAAVYVAVSFMGDGSLGVFPVGMGPVPGHQPYEASVYASESLGELSEMYAGTGIDYIRVYAVKPQEALGEMLAGTAQFLFRLVEEVAPMACNCGHPKCAAMPLFLSGAVAEA
ncbi:hypothetical protein N9917_00285 [Deltaproteobacteria bacterium]|nr:hypothetical protein [Deltaproteobacteria bacterium]